MLKHAYSIPGTLFEEYIMPLTKEVEVAYLLARLAEPQRQVSVPEETDVDWISPHIEASHLDI